MTQSTFPAAASEYPAAVDNEPQYHLYLDYNIRVRLRLAIVYLSNETAVLLPTKHSFDRVVEGMFWRG